MLKLEKVAKSLEISIALRQRDSFFSAPLLKAFAIAIALHILAGLLFQVSPFRISGSQTIFPPVLVDAELISASENSVVAQADPEEISPRYIKEPRLSSLQMPELPISATLERPPLAPLHPSVCALNCLVKDREISPLDLLSMEPAAPRKKTIEIVLSGDLAERKMIAASLTALQQGTVATPARFVYTVQVDDRTGTVFWYELHQTGENSALIAAADKMIRSLRFQPLGDSFVTAGEVEIHFNEAAAG